MTRLLALKNATIAAACAGEQREEVANLALTARELDALAADPRYEVDRFR